MILHKSILYHVIVINLIYFLCNYSQNNLLIIKVFIIMLYHFYFINIHHISKF